MTMQIKFIFLQYYRKTAQINIIIQFNGYKTII